MYILEEIKNKLVEEINNYFKDELVSLEDINYPPRLDMGDLSLVLFKLGKKINKNPNELSQELISNFNKLKAKNKFLLSVFTSGSYLNFRLDKEKISQEVLRKILKEKENYGKEKIRKSEKVMLEFSNVNTHKEYHIGHLRNVFYGDSLTRILKFQGKNALPVSYINDFGIHVAKTIWAFLEFHKDDVLSENKGEFLARVYEEASRRSKDNKIAEGIIKGIMKKIESREGEEYDLWKETREWSLDHFKKIYQELNINFIKTYYESDFIQEGFKLVNQLLEQKIFKKSEGAVIADLEKYNLGVLVILRSDGTATYPVADIPLAQAKFKDYKLKESIYIVDKAQSLYFKQLFKILELLGYKEKKRHLAYDLVKLPSGKMSSRLGNTVTYEEFKDKLISKAFKETKKRHQDWDEEKIKKVSWEISKGAMKFEMLKVGANQVITFDIDKALSFSGFTSAYLQYTFARFNSILSKEKFSEKKEFLKYLKHEKEYQIILKLGKYPEIVNKTALNYNPSELAKYLFELAQLSNDFYHSLTILKAENNFKEARLALIQSINHVLKNALDLLGISVLEEM